MTQTLPDSKIWENRVSIRLRAVHLDSTTCFATLLIGQPALRLKLNRPGIDRGSQPTDGGSHGSTKEVPG